MIRLLFHFHITVSHRLRHLSLTHIFTNHLIAFIHRTLNVIQNFLKICFILTKPGCSKQKDFLILYSLQ